MKNVIFTFILFVNFQASILAQSIGDIAFTGYNSSPAAGSDNFSFIILKTGGLPANTIIKFTDCGWIGNSAAACNTNNLIGSNGTTETDIEWTSPNSGLAYGTQVVITALSATQGTVSGTTISLSGIGDQLFAFTGVRTAPNFISGIQMNSDVDASANLWDNITVSSTTSSNRPSCLTNGTYSVWLSPEFDNATLNCFSISTNQATALAQINDPTNWSKANVTPFTLSQPPGMTITPSSQTNVSCNGDSNGAASINTPTGGAGGYTYNWTPGNPTGDGTVSVTGLTAGTWTCTVTDANSCTATQTFTITQPTVISVSALSQTNVSCNGGSNGAASINTPTGGSGGYTYNWTPGNPTGDGTVSVTGLTAGTWTCTVTDANSCTATQTFIITQPAGMTITPSSQTNVSCNGGSNGAASINTPTGGAGGYTYNWTPGNPTGDGTVSVTGLTAGTWTCTVTDANSCTATQTFTITQPTVISVSALSQTNVSCNGGSNGAASINTPTGGAGGYTYNWTPGNPTGDGTVSVTGLTAGTWTCTVTDANSCTATQTFTITQPTVILVSALSQTNVSCNGGSNGVASINTPTGGAGGYTYNWTPGNPTGDGTVSVTGLTAGTWTCTVTDANSCTATQTFTITQPTLISVSALSQTNVSCNGGSNGAASINTPTGGAGGYTYNWTPGNPTGDGTISVTGLTAGTWTCTVTDANSCTATQTFTIIQPDILSLSTSQTNVTCNGGTNGTATVSPMGGSSPYAYSWAPSGGTATTASGLIAGTYTCTITDGNSCSVTASITITEPDALTITPPTSLSVCSPSTLTLTASGCEGTVTWSQGAATGASLTISAVGTYSISATCTVNDCTSNPSNTVTGLEIKAKPNVPAVTSPSQIIVCSPNTLTLTATCGSGTVVWSDNTTGSSLTLSAIGTYTISAKCTLNGCDSDASASTNLEIKALPIAIATNTGPYLFEQTISLNASGGISYSWAGPNSFTSPLQNPSINNAQTPLMGIYTVTVTGANGCSAMATTNVSIVGIDPCVQIMSYLYVQAGDPYQTLFPLTNGQTIAKNVNQTSIIVKPICNTVPIQSVRMNIKGPFALDWTILQSYTLFSLYDNADDYVLGSNLAAGTYTLTVIGYAEKFGNGGVTYGPLVTTFTIVDNPLTISIPTLSGTQFCAGANMNVSFTTTGSFAEGNQFKVLLSDATGSFNNGPLTIGTATSAGSIVCSIPSMLVGGENYKIKVVSTDVAVSGNAGTGAFTLNPSVWNLVSPTNDYPTGVVTKQAGQTINASNSVSGNAVVGYKAGKAINLSPGFQVVASPGSSFKAQIEGCSN